MTLWFYGVQITRSVRNQRFNNKLGPTSRWNHVATTARRRDRRNKKLTSQLAPWHRGRQLQALTVDDQQMLQQPRLRQWRAALTKQAAELASKIQSLREI